MFPLQGGCVRNELRELLVGQNLGRAGIIGFLNEKLQLQCFGVGCVGHQLQILIVQSG